MLLLSFWFLKWVQNLFGLLPVVAFFLSIVRFASLLSTLCIQIDFSIRLFLNKTFFDQVCLLTEFRRFKLCRRCLTFTNPILNCSDFCHFFVFQVKETTLLVFIVYVRLWHKNSISLAVEFDNGVGKYDMIKIFGRKKKKIENMIGRDLHNYCKRIFEKSF